MTQGELADILRTSIRAIQSYEQSWRPVPVRLVIHLLTLLRISQEDNSGGRPCWKVKDCTDGKWKDCEAGTIGNGLFCWLFAPKACRMLTSRGGKRGRSYLQCPVSLQLLGED